LLALGNLIRGRPALNETAPMVELDVGVLPARQDLVRWLAIQRDRGREVTLLTSSDQEVADSIAKRFQVFDRVKGVNQSAPQELAKISYLEQIFPNGFVYVGGRRDDLKIWRRSSGIVLCGAPFDVA